MNQWWGHRIVAVDAGIAVDCPRQRVRAPVVARLIAALFALALAFPSATLAWTTEIEPGETAKLDADDGLLIVAVDTLTPLRDVRVRGIGRILNATTLRGVPAGSTLRLYRVPAGTYQWSRTRTTGLFQLTYDPSDDEQYRFTVEPGLVNYAGDLVYRQQGFSALMHVANRGVRAMDWLEKNHPAIWRDHAFHYTGASPDDFPTFYRAERQRLGVTALADDKSRKRPATPALPIPIAELWRTPRIRAARMDPSGRFVATATWDDGKHAVDVFDLRSKWHVRVKTTIDRLHELEWSSERNLLIERQGWGGHVVEVVRIDAVEGGEPKFRAYDLPRLGEIADALPAVAGSAPDTILFGSVDDRARLMIHRVAIDDAARAGRLKFKRSDRLNRGVENDVAWVADPDGNLRVALARTDEGLAIHVGSGESFAEVMRISTFDDFMPLALSPDASGMIGISSRDRSQHDLVAFDFATKKIGRALFSKPGVDVLAAAMDAKGRAVGAIYRRAGVLVTEYFDGGDARVDAAIAQHYPGANVLTVHRSADERHRLLMVEASDRPPAIVHLDVDTLAFRVVDESMPWLGRATLAPSVPVHAKSADGFALEGFLTRRRGAYGERLPLVVMPHGGPIGVADVIGFDPEVQFLASLGYAVLQVNFRGSAGYGADFAKAGHGQLGEAIEDDIDLVVREAIARHGVDGERVCWIGTSYGGYSSLVASLRWPDRVRCVVSIAGITDRQLQFSASDSARARDVRAKMIEILGDPARDRDAMRRTSPVYRYDELKTPLMLVHGYEDLRVDFEHTRRLVRMLNLAKRYPVLLQFADEGHGVTEVDAVVETWGAIAGFLQQHLSPTAVSVPLRPGAPVTPAPPVAKPASRGEAR